LCNQADGGVARKILEELIKTLAHNPGKNIQGTHKPLSHKDTKGNFINYLDKVGKNFVKV